jgi:hypothetical protein
MAGRSLDTAYGEPELLLTPTFRRGKWMPRRNRVLRHDPQRKQETSVNARTAIFAALLLGFSHGAASAASALEGRWIRECGDGRYCRVLVTSTGSSSFDVLFVLTQPSTKGTPLDTDSSAPDPTICEWNARIRQQGSADVLKGNGLTARMDGEKLSIIGIPSKCAEPGSSATFDRDDVEEFNDL